MLKWVRRHRTISALAGAAVVAAMTLAVVIGRDNVVVRSAYRDRQALLSDRAFDAPAPRADYQALVAPLATPPKP